MEVVGLLSLSSMLATTPENGGGTETDTDTNKDKPAEEQYYIVNGLENSDERCVIIPKTYNGKTVIGIGDNAFKDNTNIEEIVIPSTITTIGKNAFSGCTNLVYVYYQGLNGGWQKITIGEGNEILSSDKLCFYSETEPVNMDYVFWHIENDKPVLWEAAWSPNY